jgi:hypothetical protein
VSTRDACRYCTGSHSAYAARDRLAGATDRDLHDTVLIAAAFCMYNRYVDGLATIPLADERGYDAMAEHIVANGYANLK